MNEATFVQFITALAGAMAGACAAFWLGTEKDKKDREERDHASLVTIFYQLVARFSTVENFNRNYLAKDSNKIKEEFSDEIIHCHTPNDPLNFSTLSYLADREDSDFLAKLRLSDSNYFNFIESLEERNSAIKDLRTTLEPVDYDPQTNKFGVNADPLKHRYATVQTEILGDMAQECRRSIKKTIEDTRDVLHRRFPGQPKLTFKVAEE